MARSRHRPRVSGDTVAVGGPSRRPYPSPITVPGPGGVFGTAIPDPPAPITGTLRTVNTWAELTSAVASPGPIHITSMIVAGYPQLFLDTPGVRIYGNGNGTGTSGCRFDIRTSNIQIADLEIRDIPTSSTYDAIKIGHSVGTPMLSNIDIDTVFCNEPTRGQGILSWGSGAHDVWVRNCHIYNVGGAGAAQADGHGIYTGTATAGGCYNWYIYNNLIFANAFGLQIYSSYSFATYGRTDPHDFIISGNTIYRSNMRGMAVTGSRADYIEYVGNISYNGPTGCYEGQGTDNTGVEVWDTAYYLMGDGLITSGYPGVATGGNNLQIDPQFVNYAGGDYRLKSGSALRNHVPENRWQYLPATYRDGTTRTTGTPGSERIL